jgi:4-amino-4-deoxychorismate lyase
MMIVNGAEADTIPATDRGIAYGDGVFRTLCVENGTPRHWQRQYAKLEADCRALGIACPAMHTLRADLAMVENSGLDQAVKIIVTRGSAARGYRIPVSPQITRVVQSGPLPRYPAEYAASGVKVHACRLRLGAQPALAGVKHLNRLEQVLARAEWSDESVAEGLLCDRDGWVIGGTMTNIFISEQGRLVTPDLASSGVAGVTRDRVMDAARRNGAACTVERVPHDRVLAADEVMLVNSLAGLWRVREYSGRLWNPGPVATQVKRWLDEEEPAA